MGLIAPQVKQKRERDLAAVSHRVKKSKLTITDLVIPIASGIIFVILAFAVFIPMVSSAFEYQKQIRGNSEKIDQMESLNRRLDLLDENDLNEDVLTARSVIPQKLLVSNFVYYLDELAKQKNLSVSELSSADSINGVSGPLGYSGMYEDVISFLDDVQDVSPYMIRIENVEVGAQENGQWNISLQVSGYYMNEREEPNLYDPFTLYTDYADVVEIFERKAASLD